MNDDWLERALRSVGKGCFVKYVDEFTKSSQTDDVVRLLLSNENYTEKPCRSRVSHARGIIKAGRAHDALTDFGRSPRVPVHVRDQANRIASSLR